MKKIIYLLFLLVSTLAIGGEFEPQKLEIIAAEEVEISENSSSGELPAIEFSHGFGKFENRENAVAGFLIVQKNQHWESGKFVPQETPGEFVIPFSGAANTSYDVYLRIMAWGAVPECRPVDEIHVEWGQIDNNISLTISEEEMLVLRGGVYQGSGLWKWLKIASSVSTKEVGSNPLKISLSGGRGNYTGILIADIGFQISDKKINNKHGQP